MKETRTVEPIDGLEVTAVLNNGQVETVEIQVPTVKIVLGKSEILDLLNWLEKQLLQDSPRPDKTMLPVNPNPPTGKVNDSDIKNRTTGKTKGLGVISSVDISDMQIMDMAKPQKEVIKLTPFRIAETGEPGKAS